MVWWEERKKNKKEELFLDRAFICLASGFGSGSHGEKTAMIDVWKLWLCLFWWICQTLAGVISEIRLERGRSSSCLQTDRAEVRPSLSLALRYTLLALSGGSCWWLNKRPVWWCVVLFQHRNTGEQNRSRRADRQWKGFLSPSDWLCVFQKRKFDGQNLKGDCTDIQPTSQSNVSTTRTRNCWASVRDFAQNRTEFLKFKTLWTPAGGAWGIRCPSRFVEMVFIQT